MIKKTMLLYSYIFNNVYKGYSKFGSSNPEVYAVGVVSLLQLFTIFDIIALLNLFNFKIPNLSPNVVWILAIVYMLLNHLYFSVYRSTSVIEKKIKDLESSKILMLNIGTWIHVVITTGLFVVLVCMS